MAKTLSPQKVKVRLAGNPDSNPLFSVQVKNASGQTVDVACPKATRALVALMDMQAVMGGAASHFGGPSAFAEIMSSLHALVFEEAQKKGKEWYEIYNLVNDGGHCENGIYALKANYGFADLTLESLKGFRSIQSPLTGHGEAHLFPEGVYLSNGPLGSAVPQSQGLAFADKLAGHERLTAVAVTDGACMEGEAKEALAAIPGMAGKGQMNPYLLLISDNNTKLSGRIDEQAYPMQGTFESLEALGWNVIRLEDAHDLQSCFLAVEEALKQAWQNPEKPVALWAKTIKGYGVKKAVDSSSGGHGFPLKSANELEAFLEEIYAGEAVPEALNEWRLELVKKQTEKDKLATKPAGQVKEKVQVGVTKAMITKRQKGLPIVSVSSDLPGSTGTAGFQKEFPESSVDVGVAEANMVSMAAGLSKKGYIPVVDTFSQFGVTKGALPLIMASLSEAPVIAIFSHAGFQDAADGASHQALTYLSMTCAIPYVDVHVLSCSEEAEALVGEAIEEFSRVRQNGGVPRSQVFFLGRENFPSNWVDEGQYKLKTSQILRQPASDFAGEAVTIAAAGPLVQEALQAADQIEAQGFGVFVVNNRSINNIDTDTFKKTLELSKGRLLTLEDHQITGGMGSLLVHELLRSGVAIHRLRSLGVDGGFGQSAYKALELYAKHSLDSVAVIDSALELLQN